MNKVASQISKQIQQEASQIEGYLKNIDELVKSGEENAVETVQLFEDMVIDGVDHLQKLAVALTNCFFQKDDKEVGGNE